VRVVKNDFHGPLILAVKNDTRLAIGRGLAHRIRVQSGEPDTNSPQQDT
jgi:Fe2+ transport system protein FeoA